jgi:hypothetical protein
VSGLWPIYIEELQSKRPLWRTRLGWKDNNEIDLEEIGFENVKKVHLSQ